jgi:histidinol-phosphate phosphatase family protein
VKETPKKLTIDREFTLFLDRDGVINKRLVGDYVRTTEAFELLPGVLDFLSWASPIFYRIIVVTNQQGIGKKLMTIRELDLIHQHFLELVAKAGGRIDDIYFAPQLKAEKHPDRKPGSGMALRAKADHPMINFSKSIMVGDSPSDLAFGHGIGMKTAFVITPEVQERPLADLYLPSLAALRQRLTLLK